MGYSLDRPIGDLATRDAFAAILLLTDGRRL